MDNLICKTCGRELPADQFHFSKGRPWGCKECFNQYQRDYFKKHPQKTKEYNDKYRERRLRYHADHKEQRDAHNKEYKEHHPDYWKEWHIKNREHRSAYQKEYRRKRKQQANSI